MTEAPHRLPVRIYYEDTDFSGVVYHANYLRFMERGRTEFLRTLGVDQAQLTDESGQPLAFVVRQMTVDFLRPARMDDQVIVETLLGAQAGASLVLDQRILRADEILITAAVKVALVGGGRARRFPPALAAKISARTASPSMAEIALK
ncbi:tol-pal system-associated acyl-CoA thioesterase [Lichenifustis flavocetrariae]|uniref:Tol-pal system-associated acyl-CoA thioesterase n=1 Tax=Lichenifustis flavocetrariae TaxID=2949735 RepID=A0AA41YTD3_9HYPH|nr:tol-pal system-associated acyl-CoA thioesterase [Lichenifustis flavocetrariae]MCW6508234.1 tol-pal system-associated acyl-CoA thioesterase [Lichenifustis flavocetrariae]